mgnify:CR=1 FL=1
MTVFRKACRYIWKQITRETDSAYYDMISIVNQMSPSGLIGNVVESYLSAEDNFDKYTGQKSLREELVKLGYVNTKAARCYLL